MFYENLPYDDRVAERFAYFSEISVREQEEHKLLWAGPPETIASRYTAHDAKFSALKEQMLRHVDRILPLLPPSLSASVFSVFKCPVVAKFDVVEIGSARGAYDRWCKIFASLKKTFGEAQALGYIARWLVDTGPQFYGTSGGPIVAGFLSEKQCGEAVQFIESAHKGFVSLAIQANTRPCAVAGVAEGTGTYRVHDLFGNVDLQIEPNDSADALRLDFHDRDHGVPEHFARSIFEGIRYAASFGREFGNPIVNSRVKVLGSKVHEMDSQPTAYVRAAAIAFREAIENVTLRPVEC